MKRLLEFLSYHNAVPIAFGILFLGAGVGFAASPEAREAVFDAETIVASIDNSYLLAADIEHFSFSIQITAVTEDDTHYFVSYTLTTIDLVESAWRDAVKEKTLSVEKAFLAGRDLGVYVTKELAEVRDAERARLLETQAIEQGLGESQKVVATVYSGLVGRLLSPTEEAFEGYAPVVAATEPASEPATAGSPAVAGASASVAGSASSDTKPPVITIFGNNPAQIERGVRYSDLGFLALDNATDNVSTYTYFNEKKTLSVFIDTSYDATYTVTYEAIDPSGNVARATRTVIVGTGGEEPDPDLEPEPE